MPSRTPIAGTAVPPSTAPRPGRRPLDPIVHSLVGEFLTEQKEEREAAARSKRPPRPWRRIASISAIVACGAVWLVPSLGTRPAPEMSAERQDASARLTLFLAAQRVREFEQKNARLPASLGQAGVTDSRISIRRMGEREFSLTLVHDGRHWDLPSTTADSAYLGAALTRLGITPKSR